MHVLEKLVLTEEIDLETIGAEKSTLLNIIVNNVSVDDIPIIQFIDLANIFNLTLDELYIKLKYLETHSN